ncbi:MAG: hypothetical protein ABFD62_10200 [Syntrophaceae bacterium]
MTLLKPKSLGPVPQNLDTYHREFLTKIKDTIDIWSGKKQSQSDETDPPRSQLITFGDLKDVPEYADNTKAKAAGLYAGDLYRTGDTLKVVH